MVIFNKICLVVGQIVVGSILGLLYVHFAWKWIDWVDDHLWDFKSRFAK